MGIPWTCRRIWILAGSGMLLCLLASLSLRPGTGDPARSPAWRLRKIGPPAELGLRILSGPEPDPASSSEPPALRVEIALRIAPGADMPGATVDLLVPEGWEILSGSPSFTEDLLAGGAVERTFLVRIPPGAPPGGGSTRRPGAGAPVRSAREE